MTFKTILVASTMLAVTVSGQSAFANSNKHVIKTQSAYEAASSLVGYTTLARYALANNNPEKAKEFIEGAKTSGKTLAALSADKRKVSNIQSGRIEYNNNAPKDGAYYYYPVETATVTQKDIGFGPFWKKDENKGLAVKDAEFIYVTVNIAGIDVQKNLTKAEKEIDNKKYEDASDELQDLIEDVVTVEDRKEAYALKARDNLELARFYFDNGDYAAARYPFKHAKSALEKMKGNKDYPAQQELISKYLEEIDQSEKVITMNDPTALDKFKATLKADWEGMKDWADKKTN